MADFWDSAKSILQGVAPVLGTALGGPVGGAAASMISKAIFGDEQHSQEEIAEKLASGNLTPEQFAALKKAEFDFKKHLSDNNIKIDEIAAQDRKSARSLTLGLATAGHRAAWSAPIISVVVVVGFFLIIYALFRNEIPEGSREIALILLGALGAGFTQVLNFWLGSSKGSKDKTEALTESLRGR